MTEWLDVFVNAGYLNRTPVFSNVIGYDNQIVENIKNEKIMSMEWELSGVKIHSLST